MPRPSRTQGRTLLRKEATQHRSAHLIREGAVVFPGRSSDSGAWTCWFCLAWRLPGLRQCRYATLVPQYRCASVPESHRIPGTMILRWSWLII